MTQDYHHAAQPHGAKFSGQSPHRGFYSRGYLAHWDAPGLFQCITYRLSDSLPLRVLERMRQELRYLPAKTRDSELKRRIEELLDSGIGSCVLRLPEAARCVVETWQRFDGERYRLCEWTVMPNHVHMLIKTREGCPLAKVVQSWKTYTARHINLILKHHDKTELRPFWMRDYWDRYIRDEEHLASAIEYIQYNPVKAGLVERPQDWRWGSVASGT